MTAALLPGGSGRGSDGRQSGRGCGGGPRFFTGSPTDYQLPNVKIKSLFERQISISVAFERNNPTVQYSDGNFVPAFVVTEWTYREREREGEDGIMTEFALLRHADYSAFASPNSNRDSSARVCASSLGMRKSPFPCTPNQSHAHNSRDPATKKTLQKAPHIESFFPHRGLVGPRLTVNLGPCMACLVQCMRDDGTVACISLRAPP